MKITQIYCVTNKVNTYKDEYEIVWIKIRRVIFSRFKVFTDGCKILDDTFYGFFLPGF